MNLERVDFEENGISIHCVVNSGEHIKFYKMEDNDNYIKIQHDSNEYATIRTQESIDALIVYLKSVRRWLPSVIIT